MELSEMNSTPEGIAFLQKELSYINEPPSAKEEYLKALKENDIEKLSLFSSLGFTIRHRVRNYHQYQAGLQFGFTELTLSRFGWLKNETWLNEEEIIITVKGAKKTLPNKVTIARGLKVDSYTYSVDVDYGGHEGSYSAISVYGPISATREEALMGGLLEIKKAMLAKLDFLKAHPENKSGKASFINKVLEEINEMIPGEIADQKENEQQQLQLF